MPERRSVKWKMVPLGEIADIKLGKMLDRAKHTTGRKLPYLRNVNVRWGAIETDDLLEMYFQDEELERFALQDKDVLVCEGGEPGRAAVWSGGPTELKFQKALHRVRFRVPFEPRLLVYLLELLAKTGRIENRFTGSTIKHFTREAFLQLPVPLLPLDEQRRIVSEIEKQFTRLDAAVAALERALLNSARYRGALLTAAIEGQLSKTRESRDSWRNVTLGEVAEAVQYGTSAKASNDSSGFPVLAMGNLQDGRIRLNRLRYLPKKHPEFPQLFLQVGDLLFNRTNSAELVGKSAVYRGTPAPCSFASYLIRVRLKTYCHPDYVSYVLNSSFGRAWIAKVASQQVGQANVNGTKLRSLAFALPTLAEQEKLVSQVERRLSTIEEVDRVAHTNLRRAKNLRQAILQRAFSGQL